MIAIFFIPVKSMVFSLAKIQIICHRRALRKIFLLFCFSTAVVEFKTLPHGYATRVFEIGKIPF